MKTILRSIGAVVVGYAICVILIVAADMALGAVFGKFGPKDTNTIFKVSLVMTAAGLVAAVAGGYAAGWAAGRAPVAHALALGLLMAAIGAAMLISGGGTPMPLPAWYKWSMLVIPIPGVLLGGWLRTKCAVKT